MGIVNDFAKGLKVTMRQIFGERVTTEYPKDMREKPQRFHGRHVLNRYPDGMEENYETYRVANREMADISELLLVHNVTPEIYEKLKPHITALPTPTTRSASTKLPRMRN